MVAEGRLDAGMLDGDNGGCSKLVRVSLLTFPMFESFWIFFTVVKTRRHFDASS